MGGRKWMQCVGVCFLVAVAIFMMGERVAQAQPPSGDYCFTVRMLQTEDGPTDKRVLARVRFAPLDDQIAAMHGYVTVAGDNPYILTGMGNQVGEGSVYINLNTTQKHKSEPWVDTGVMQMKLNPDTLGGTFTEIRTDYNTSTGEFMNGYTSGTVSQRNCP